MTIKQTAGRKLVNIGNKLYGIGNKLVQDSTRRQALNADISTLEHRLQEVTAQGDESLRNGRALELFRDCQTRITTATGRERERLDAIKKVLARDVYNINVDKLDA